MYCSDLCYWIERPIIVHSYYCENSRVTSLTLYLSIDTSNWVFTLYTYQNMDCTFWDLGISFQVLFLLRACISSSMTILHSFLDASSYLDDSIILASSTKIALAYMRFSFFYLADIRKGLCVTLSTCLSSIWLGLYSSLWCTPIYQGLFIFGELLSLWSSIFDSITSSSDCASSTIVCSPNISCKFSFNLLRI